MLVLCLLLVLHTCRRQLQALKCCQRIARIKRMQYEARKNVKLEQESFQQLRDALHANMLQRRQQQTELQTEPELANHCEPLLDELSRLLRKINAQLQELESALDA
ncbi:hypothetical protein KR222_008279, partial [Zaprionus bogoriensis]